MTTLLEIKPYIFDFVKENLDESFTVFWIGQYVDEPQYPYCMLTELTENKDKRTSRHYGNLVDGKRESITTRYKTAVITVGIYNAFVQSTYDEMDMDEAKEFAYEQIDLLEGEFENYPINSKFSVQNISPIRTLHEPVSGGYMYRYEFDLTIGYNEARSTNEDIGHKVDLDIEAKDNTDNISFIITMDNNDNIDIEYN